MLRSASRLFCPVFAAFFGCISLLGQGLHVLVEHPLHEGAASVCACSVAHATCTDRGHTHRGCGHFSVAAPAQGAAPSEDESHRQPFKLAGDTTHDPHLCPICGFFAQAQWAVDFQPEWHATSIAPVAQHAEFLRPVAPVGVYQSRAPPICAAIS